MIDPHKDLIEDLLLLIPPERVSAVLLLDLTDTEYIVALKPLDASMGFSRDQAVANVMSSFERVWSDFWGPSLSIARLAQAYPVDRDDLWTRLARPEVHLVLSELVSRLLAEGTPQAHLVSYQRPWLQMDTVFARPRLRPFSSDAALLIQQAAEEQYAFLVHVDTGSVQKEACQLFSLKYIRLSPS